MEKIQAGGDKMAKNDDRIKCTVDNCAYWDSDFCGADKIEVAKNFMGGNDTEAGMLGKNSGDSAQTQCVTFKPKNK